MVKIEEGKYYRSVNGNIYGPVIIRKAYDLKPGQLPVAALCNNDKQYDSFTIDGIYNPWCICPVCSKYDLIEECEAPNES